MIRSILSNWMALIIMGVTSIILTPILIHSLGDFYYGLWVLVGSALDYYGLLDLGMRPALFRSVAWSKGANDLTAMHEALSAALAFTIGIGACSLLATGALIPIVPGFFHVDPAAKATFTWLIVILSLNLAVAFPTRMLGAYLCSLERFDLYNATAIGTTVGRAVLIVWALHVGKGVCWVAAIMLAMTILSLLIHWRLLSYVDSRITVRWKHIRLCRIKELFNYGSFAFINNIGNQLRLYTDSLVIGRMLGAVLITQFSVATKLVGYFNQIMSGISGPVMGRMSELDGQTREVDLRRHFLRTTRMTALVATLIGVVMVANGRLIITLWVGRRFDTSYPLLLLLGACFTVSLSLQSNWVVILARAKHRPMALWNVLEGVVNFILSVHWSKSYGLIGVALGTVIPMLISDLFVWPWYALRILHLTAGEYIRKGLAGPLYVSAIFSFICWWGQLSLRDATFVNLAVATLLECIAFSVLAYVLALESSERKMLRQQCKQMFFSLGLARAS